MARELTPWIDARLWPNPEREGIYITCWSYDNQRRGWRRRRHCFYSYWSGDSWHYGHRTLKAAQSEARRERVRPLEAATLVSWRGRNSPT